MNIIIIGYLTLFLCFFGCCALHSTDESIVISILHQLRCRWKWRHNLHTIDFFEALQAKLEQWKSAFNCAIHFPSVQVILANCFHSTFFCIQFFECVEGNGNSQSSCCAFSYWTELFINLSLNWVFDIHRAQVTLSWRSQCHFTVLKCVLHTR